MYVCTTIETTSPKEIVRLKKCREIDVLKFNHKHGT